MGPDRGSSGLADLSAGNTSAVTFPPGSDARSDARTQARSDAPSDGRTSTPARGDSPEDVAAPPAPSVGPLAVRRAGILLHVTSLPSMSGTGDLGPSAYRFVDFLDRAGCTVWQVLPLVPTHGGDRSPYNAISAMAGNPELVALEGLVDRGWLTEEELAEVREGDRSREEALDAAAARHRRAGDTEAYDRWCRDNAEWLDSYVEFVAIRETLDRTPWTSWEPGLRDREPAAMERALVPLADRLHALRFSQWVFASQWASLREYAAARGVLFFGDLPIFVSQDSADVWASRELFQLDEEGNPETVTGVPPDYFAEDGQRWNNPHYDWERMAEDGFAWWRLRIRRQRELFDLVRIDHFRGFQASWHVPAEAETAREGEWVLTPGRDVLAALVEASGPGTLVAEDLGVITEEVEELRDRFGLPGMKVLQFAFNGDDDNPYLPERHGRQAVVYTGTHDNDTTMGWWAEQDAATRRRTREHTGPADMPWALIATAMASSAQLAVVPAQDLLGLGSDSRMNTPGSASGNWRWQAGEELFDAAIADRLRALVEEHGRRPPGLS
jgi:4-alpha-glucanotransferase